MLKKCFCFAGPRRMPAYTTIYATVLETYVSVYQRMSDIFHTLTYATAVFHILHGEQRCYN